jgi:FlaA1/EpsC-like NDP-sugar epimerase
LITEGEGIFRSTHEKILILKGNNNDLNWLNQKIEELVKLALDQDANGIKSKLKEIVPEYEPYEP